MEGSAPLLVIVQPDPKVTISDPESATMYEAGVSLLVLRFETSGSLHLRMGTTLYSATHYSYYQHYQLHPNQQPACH